MTLQAPVDAAPTPLAPHSTSIETPLRRVLREFGSSRLAPLGLVVLVLIALLASVAPLIAPQNPYDLMQLDIMDGRLPPGSQSMSGMTFWL